MESQSGWTDPPAYTYRASTMVYPPQPKVDPDAPLALPDALRSRLAGVRRKYQGVHGIHGVARVAMVFLFFVVGTFILDYLLETPVGFRLGLLAVATAGIISATWEFLLRPLVFRLTDDQVALLVEAKNPDLQDALITAVQLSRARDERERGYSSRSLVQAVVTDVMARAERIDFARAVDAGPAVRLFLLVMAVGATVGGAFGLKPDLGRRWFERVVLLDDTPYPRDTAIVVHPHPQFVARGDDLEVVVEVTSASGRRIFGSTIEAEFESAPGTLEAEPMVGTGGPNLWRHVFRNITEPFRFRVAAGDAETRWHAIEVRARPKAEDIRFWLEFPPYTHREATPSDRPLRQWNLEVPAGTVVHFQAVANRDLGAPERQSILFDPPGSTEIVRPMGLEGTRDLVGAFRVLEATRYAFSLVDSGGLDTGTPSRYEIRAVRDNPPVIRVAQPARTRDEAMAGATIPIEARVQDDYGVRDAALAIEVRPAGTGREPQTSRVVLRDVPSAETETVVTLTHEMALAPYGLQPGDTVRFTIEARDFAPADRVGRSETFQIDIVDQGRLESHIAERIARLRDDLRDIVRMQEGTRSDVLEVVDATRERGAAALTFEERQRMTLAEMDQRRVSNRLAEAQAESERIVDLAVRNQVGGQDSIQRLRDLAQALGNLATERSPQIAEELAAVRAAEALDGARLESVPVAQQRVIQALEDLIRQIETSGRVSEILRDLRDLFERQRGIHEGTQERAREDLLGR